MKIVDIQRKGKQGVDFPVYATVTIDGVDQKVTKFKVPYFAVKLSDDSGKINGMRFFVDNNDYSKSKQFYVKNTILSISGTYNAKFKNVSIESETAKGMSSGQTTVHQSAVIVSSASSAANETEMIEYLRTTIRGISNEFLKELLRKVFNDEDLRTKFFERPAAFKHHHNFKCGILCHTVNMLKMCEFVNTLYQPNVVNLDLLKTAIIVHDLGKIRVYTIKDGVAAYVHEDKMVDHIKVGDLMISEITASIPNFPAELKKRIHGLIVSHHGKKEWGSIKEPESNEEWLLHNLDMVDSRFATTEVENKDDE